MGNPVGRLLVTRFNLLVEKFIPASHKRRTLSEPEMTHYCAPTATPNGRHAAAVLPGELVGAAGSLPNSPTGSMPSATCQR
jgi:haloalkane dehalogenase